LQAENGGAGLFTPYDRPCDIDSTAPEPGETAMMEAATTKVIQVAKGMRFPKMGTRGNFNPARAALPPRLR